jgi:hypothetical protein
MSSRPKTYSGRCPDFPCTGLPSRKPIIIVLRTDVSNFCGYDTNVLLPFVQNSDVSKFTHIRSFLNWGNPSRMLFYPGISSILNTPCPKRLHQGMSHLPRERPLLPLLIQECLFRWDSSSFFACQFCRCSSKSFDLFCTANTARCTSIDYYLAWFQWTSFMTSHIYLLNIIPFFHICRICVLFKCIMIFIS